MKSKRDSAGKRLLEMLRASKRANAQNSFAAIYSIHQQREDRMDYRLVKRVWGWWLLGEN